MSKKNVVTIKLFLFFLFALEQSISYYYYVQPPLLSNKKIRRVDLQISASYFIELEYIKLLFNRYNNLVWYKDNYLQEIKLF